MDNTIVLTVINIHARKSVPVTLLTSTITFDLGSNNPRSNRGSATKAYIPSY